MAEPKRRRSSGALITSPSNERMQFLRSLNRAGPRHKEGLFVAEGVRLVEDALDSGAEPEVVLTVPEQLAATPRGRALLERCAPFTSWQTTEAVMKTVAEAVSPQGVLAVFRVPEVELPRSLGALFLVLDGLRDPGNAGTILRAAEASGLVRAVALIDSVDPYAPKVVRAGAGAHFRLRIWHNARWPDVGAALRDRPTWLAVPRAGDPYDLVDWRADSALIVGGEAEGASRQAAAVATGRVTIPMSGPIESLNAAMATTVILFEAARARRRGQREARHEEGQP